MGKRRIGRVDERDGGSVGQVQRDGGSVGQVQRDGGSVGQVQRDGGSVGQVQLLPVCCCPSAPRLRLPLTHQLF
ncbi:hypothetical protein FKM82_004270 [Ascaphus truei]